MSGDWRDYARCREIGPYLFFLDSTVPQARAVCATCPVQRECLAFGVHEDGGVWGGLDEHERARLSQS